MNQITDVIGALRDWGDRHFVLFQNLDGSPLSVEGYRGLLISAEAELQADSISEESRYLLLATLDLIRPARDRSDAAGSEELKRALVGAERLLLLNRVALPAFEKSGVEVVIRAMHISIQAYLNGLKAGYATNQ